MVTLAFYGSVIALVAVCLTGHLTFDGLIRHEHRFHRHAWEKDGRPRSLLFFPPETTPFFSSRFATGRCFENWLFFTPSWVSGDSAAKTLLSRFRWSVLIWNIGVVALYVLILFHSIYSSL
jgi:hypothetical protein